MDEYAAFVAAKSEVLGAAGKAEAAKAGTKKGLT